MEQRILSKYFNVRLNIRLSDIRIVYLLSPDILQLIPEVYKGRLVYRLKGFNKKINSPEFEKRIDQENFCCYSSSSILISRSQNTASSFEDALYITKCYERAVKLPYMTFFYTTLLYKDGKFGKMAISFPKPG